MSISQLANKLAAYDPFYEHRINGLKAVFVLELLFLINFIYTIPQAYFYFFYMPLTAFAAEVAGYNLKDKYLFFFLTMMGSILAVWVFGMSSLDRTFFVFMVFFYALGLYFTAVYCLKSMLVPAPLILSLAAYSLVYGNSDANFYVGLNHALASILAMLVVLAGLLFFPKSLYLTIWRRGFYALLGDLDKISYKLYYNQLDNLPIVIGLVVMERYSGMLSRRRKSYSVLKITLLSSELVMAMSYLYSFRDQIRLEYVELLQRYTARLHEAVASRSLLKINPEDLAIFNATYELRCLFQIIKSWNYLCLSE